VVIQEAVIRDLVAVLVAALAFPHAVQAASMHEVSCARSSADELDRECESDCVAGVDLTARVRTPGIPVVRGEVRTIRATPPANEHAFLVRVPPASRTPLFLRVLSLLI
jgi:hypothetical protein